MSDTTCQTYARRTESVCLINQNHTYETQCRSGHRVHDHRQITEQESGQDHTEQVNGQCLSPSAYIQQDHYAEIGKSQLDAGDPEIKRYQ